MTTKLTKNDIKGFQAVLDYLKENQKGAFGIEKLQRFELCVYQYQGIGEGMDFEVAEEYNIKELVDYLKTIAVRPIMSDYENFRDNASWQYYSNIGGTINAYARYLGKNCSYETIRERLAEISDENIVKDIKKELRME
jgi:hypothetical protein